MDIFESKNIEPMLISEMKDPFNSNDWIYELKLDGCRCVAYLNEKETVLRNKRNLDLLFKFPELKDINQSVNKKSILDGELIVLKNGVPDFYEMQRRTIMTDRFKIELAVSMYPASFVAYDIIYSQRKQLTDLQLIERKKYLSDGVRENEKIAVSRYIEENGIELYQLADERELEGVVAKRKASLYHFGKKTKDWIKFKRMADEEFIICGYIQTDNNKFSLILGKYRNGTLIYKGHISTGVSKDLIQSLRKDECSLHIYPDKYNDAVWTKLVVGIVEYMPNTKNTLRQASFKGIRYDILLEEVIEE